MEKKYYTPTIEEFHIGFEYEWSGYGRKIWIEEKATWGDLDEIFDDYEHNPEDFHKIYRVKYLDKDDLKELKFIHNYKKDNHLDTDEHSCNAHQYLLKDVPFCNSSRNVDVKLTYLGKEESPNIYLIEVFEKNYFEWFTIFEGIVRNGAELKNLLKNQFGILK